MDTISSNSVTKSDMRLKTALFGYSGRPEDIPLSMDIGGKVIKGIPASFSPKTTYSFGDNSYTFVTIEGTDKNGLNIRAEYKEYKDFPVVEWTAYIKNTGNASTPVISDIKFTYDIKCKSPVLYHGNGDNCTYSGYEFYTDKITDKMTLSPVDGTSCNGAFPYMRLVTEDFGVNIAIGWPAKWEATFDPENDGIGLTVKQSRTHFEIYSGETMRTPCLTLMPYIGDSDKACNIWRKWYLKHILPVDSNADTLKPKLCLHTWHIDGKEEFCGCTEKNQQEAIETYVKKGLTPDIWWIDAGWYPCEDHWVNVGDWSVRKDNFPNGLGPVGTECDKYGIQFLLWFEPERVVTDMKIDKEHPEWVLKNYNEDGSRTIYSLLDMSNDECTDYIIETFDKIVKEGKVKVYREDYNIAPLPYWQRYETENRVGAMENRHVQNHLRLWDTLIFRNPGLFIDSCSSGGRRNDLEIMKRAVPLHYTDVGYGNHPTKQKQHREMFEWIPYFRAHTYNWDDENKNYIEWQTQKFFDDFAFLNAYAPAMTCMIEYYHDEKQFDEGRKMIPIWRKAADIMLSGDYYPLTVCRNNPSDWYAMQFDDPEKNTGFIEVIRNILVTEDEYVIYARHLDIGAEYVLTNGVTGDTFTVSGSELTAGYKVNLPERSGLVLFYRKAE